MRLAFAAEINYHRIIPLQSGHFRCFSGKVDKMFRLWARTFKDNHMLQDTCIADGSADTRTHKVLRALDEVCYQFDLSRPIWLDKTVQEFRRHSKVRFAQDNFVDGIDFDYLEIQVIEED